VAHNPFPNPLPLRTRGGRPAPCRPAGRGRRGFTLLEVLLVLGILGMLVALALPVLAAARRSARVVSCTGNLRQLGMAYQLYETDYGAYPEPHALLQGGYVQDRRSLFCPEDRTLAELHAASSYNFTFWAPPDFRRLSQMSEVDPNVVLVSCGHHLDRQVRVLSGDRTETSAPRYPFYFALRAGGAVDRIPASHVRQFRVPGDRPTFQTAFPGEPGYEEAER